jgi:hypothetical protein
MTVSGNRDPGSTIRPLFGWLRAYALGKGNPVVMV